MLLETIIAAHFLVIDPNGCRSDWDIQPSPQQVHAGAQILELPADFKPLLIQDYQPDAQNPGKAVYVKPAPLPDTRTPEQKSEQDARNELTKALSVKAGDKAVSQDTYNQMLRIEKMETVKADWDKLKSSNPEVEP